MLFPRPRCPATDAVVSSRLAALPSPLPSVSGDLPFRRPPRTELRITRGMLPRRTAAACINSTVDNAGSTDCTGISRPLVPRPVPRRAGERLAGAFMFYRSASALDAGRRPRHQRERAGAGSGAPVVGRPRHALSTMAKRSRTARRWPVPSRSRPAPAPPARGLQPEPPTGRGGLAAPSALPQPHAQLPVPPLSRHRSAPGGDPQLGPNFPGPRQHSDRVGQLHPSARAADGQLPQLGSELFGIPAPVRLRQQPRPPSPALGQPSVPSAASPATH